MFMDTIIKNYLSAFDELNTLIDFRFQETEKLEKKKRAEIILEDFLSFLILAYQNGIQDFSEMTKKQVKPDTSEMNACIYLRIDGLTFEDRAKEHIQNDDLMALKILAGDEYHRVYETAKFNAAKKTGSEKTWVTMSDYKVRDTHAYLEGMTIRAEARFYTYDGDSALFPGDFSMAENNCGCRCIAVYR